MYDRRYFLQTGMLAGAALAAACRTPSRSSIESAVARLAETAPPDDVATDEQFWYEVRQAHDLAPKLVNLNHGLSPAHRTVQGTLLAQMERVNQIPVLRERDHESEKGREESRAAAARVLGCDAEGVALVRSGTESLHMAQLGITDELGCDYYGTSGHKWLQAPLGTGLLYVRRERIRDLWPPPGSWNDGYESGDIRKFEVLGSRTPAYDIAIGDAVHVLEQLGVERKAARLRYLTRRWALRLREHPRIRLVTDLEPGRSCGIGAFYVEGFESQLLADHLLDQYGIFVGPPSEDAWSGPPLVRVVPNVFTSVDEIDMFVDAVEETLAA